MDSLTKPNWENFEALSIPQENLKFTLTNLEDKQEINLLEQQADKGNAEAQFKVGNFYARGKEIRRCYKTAFKYYTLSSQQNYPRSFFSLAQLYEEGLGTPKSIEKAFFYYKLAADTNSSLLAFKKIGEFYEQGLGISKSIPKAIEYYEEAVNQGDITSYLSLAKIYENCEEVQSKEKANHYYQKYFLKVKIEADKGDAFSQAIVGRRYENGIRVEKSLKSALYYYELSEKQNHELGQYYLGNYYAHGKSCEVLEKAIHYYKLSAEQGNTFAMSDLAKILIKNKIEEEIAVHYLKLVIQSGLEKSVYPFGRCAFQLGECFENGIGVSKSLQNALYYYVLASNADDTEAQCRLGDAYIIDKLEKIEFHNDSGSEDLVFYKILKSIYKPSLGIISPEKAIHYYGLAATQEDPLAIVKLAVCYEIGLGVEQSSETAFQQYKKAASIAINEQFALPIFILARCYEQGIGTKVSVQEATYYYKLAAKLG